MACYRPLYGWQDEVRGGPLKFGAERSGHRRVDIPCGYCIGCRLARARSWAIRCMHEAQLHDRNCFVTLTYDDKHLEHPGLRHRDFQTFLRVLRRRIGKCRYFMCGEYGELNNRPHFHAILFGVDFEDKVPYGKNLYRSSTLESLWTKGFSSLGEANFQTAGYVARYNLKKRHGPAAVEHYKRVDTTTGEILQIAPEYAQMSLKPGIGYNWFIKYFHETSIARDGVILRGGKSLSVPRYYSNILETIAPDIHEWRTATRYKNIQTFEKDTTPERLKVREAVAIAQEKMKGRKI